MDTAQMKVFEGFGSTALIGVLLYFLLKYMMGQLSTELQRQYQIMCDLIKEKNEIRKDLQALRALWEAEAAVRSKDIAKELAVNNSLLKRLDGKKSKV